MYLLMRLLLMDDGLIILHMVLYGFVAFPVLLRIHPEVTGSILTTVGCGCQIIVGDGHHSIMVAGHLMQLMDGCGFRDTNGDRPGFHGVRVVTSTVGHRFLPALISV